MRAEMGRIASLIVAAGRLGVVVAVLGPTAGSSNALADPSVDPPVVVMDSSGATAVALAPSQAAASGPATRRDALAFVEFGFGWFHPERPEGDLALQDSDSWTMNWSVGGHPAAWLDLMAEVDVRGASLEGPPPLAKPGVTLSRNRELGSVFAGLTGRLVYASGPARPFVSLSLGVVRSTMTAEGTEAVEIFSGFGFDPPTYIPMPYSMRKHDTAAQAIVGAGVRFPSRHNPDIGLAVRYSTLRQSFGEMGTARVGGLSVEITLQFDPHWKPGQRPSARSS